MFVLWQFQSFVGGQHDMVQNESSENYKVLSGLVVIDHAWTTCLPQTEIEYVLCAISKLYQHAL